MNTSDKTSTITNDVTRLPVIDGAALDTVTGGCASCGQDCAAGAIGRPIGDPIGDASKWTHELRR